MAKFLGRNLTLTWNSAPIAGVLTKGVALAAEPVDVTDDDSSGWKELLAEAGEKSVTLSLSGLASDDTLRAAWFDTSSPENRVASILLTYPDGGVISGDFFLASYNETGPSNGATTFESELQSTGAVTYA